jgi:predicted transcriptional regulator
MEKLTLLKLIEKGYSTYDISKELSIGQTSVRYWLKKHGLKTQRTLHKEQRVNTSETITSKVCFKCKQLKNITDFYKINRRNKISYYSNCKDCCRSETSLSNKRVFYKKQLVEYKGGKCEKCGYNSCLNALEFHHRDPTEKEISITNLFKWGKLDFESAKKEIDKCSLLCANCHREIHSKTSSIIS